MVEPTAVSCIQSSHPDKYNNSMNRIISKEKEREDIQGEILQSSSTVVFPHSTKKSNIPTRTTVFLHAIQQVSSHPVQRKLFYI